MRNSRGRRRHRRHRSHPTYQSHVTHGNCPIYRRYPTDQSCPPKLESFVDFYLVIDFEATTKSKYRDYHLPEIIEFPALLIDASTLEVFSEFHSYVRPTINRTLSKFCKRLTGISQASRQCFND
ncbi:ERI1 exoribonuclease 2 [Trichoplax sp. H2]|nr:ERI1 exoribonuclease 2 [Trichoplax sp. H2]|eukprot:RDD37736.1 ERI1 exoribonuclease 2 [Trichoplax sp. H2]